MTATALRKAIPAGRKQEEDAGLHQGAGHRILEVSTSSQTIAFFLEAYAGLRSSEVKALRWSDVELAQRFVVSG
ncbi:hypothetical protein [Sorangium sp. So ce233]|uniref:hypothetical protein n=1 Tax=Sorangium sp. So ce233 TaxID=3133290 RepID=UPI003F637C85